MKKILILFALMAAAAAQSATCTVDLRGIGGAFIDTFQEWGNRRANVCQRALRQCERELTFRQRLGHNRFAYCQIRNFRNDHLTTRTCHSRLVRRGNRRYGPRVIRNFTASETGYTERNIQQRACRAALQKCNRFKNRNGYYRAQCVRAGRLTPIRRGGVF